MEQGARLREELLREELQDAEVREILERLSAEDFGGSELSTIAAVSEATGASPEAIARMLAEIRQDDLEERFGSVLRKHETQIGQHGERLDRHSSEIERFKRAAPSSIRYGEDVDEELVRMAEERIRERKLAPAYTIFAIFIVFLIIVMASKPRTDNEWTPSTKPTVTRTGPYLSTPTHAVSKTLSNGDIVIVDREGNATVQETTGNKRPPNPVSSSENAAVAQLQQEMRVIKNRETKP